MNGHVTVVVAVAVAAGGELEAGLAEPEATIAVEE